MALRTRIYKPKSKLNELENRYKVVVWKNGIQCGVKFADTKKQILEKKIRLMRQCK